MSGVGFTVGTNARRTAVRRKAVDGVGKSSAEGVGLRRASIAGASPPASLMGCQLTWVPSPPAVQ